MHLNPKRKDLGFRVWGLGMHPAEDLFHRVQAFSFNVNLVLLNPRKLKCARCPGRNNKALGIKYASRGLFFFGGVRCSLFVYGEKREGGLRVLWFRI